MANQNQHMFSFPSFLVFLGVCLFFVLFFVCVCVCVCEFKQLEFVYSIFTIFIFYALHVAPAFQTVKPVLGDHPFR